jgi:hypothetical protein
MLGAQVRFTADVTVNGSPATGGTWEWSADDTFRRAQPLDDLSKLFVYWNTEGNHNVSALPNGTATAKDVAGTSAAHPNIMCRFCSVRQSSL